MYLRPQTPKHWLASVACAAALLSPISSEIGFLPLAPTEAHADAASRGEARRVSRRTSRRVERRHDRYNNYITVLPGGCAKVSVNGVSYWRCGSVHYQGIVDNGETIYIVVNL